MQEDMDNGTKGKSPAPPKKAPSTDPDRDKTVGVRVPPRLYTKLVRLKGLCGYPSIKAALLLAAETGIDEALGEK